MLFISIDILLLIADHVDDPRDYFRMLRVCRDWNEVLSPGAYKRVSLQNDQVYGFVRHIYKNPCLGAKIRDLRIRLNGFLTRIKSDAELVEDAVQRACNNPRSIQVWTSWLKVRHLDAWLGVLVQSLEGVTSLSLDYSADSDYFVPMMGSAALRHAPFDKAPVLQHLERLTIKSDEKDASLTAFAFRFIFWLPSLRVFTANAISELYSESESSMYHPVPKPGTSPVKEIRLGSRSTSCNGGKEIAKYIVSCANLEIFEYQHGKAGSTSILEKDSPGFRARPFYKALVTQKHSLRELRLNDCGEFEGYPFVSLFESHEEDNDDEQMDAYQSNGHQSYAHQHDEYESFDDDSSSSESDENESNWRQMHQHQRDQHQRNKHESSSDESSSSESDEHEGDTHQMHQHQRNEYGSSSDESSSDESSSSESDEHKSDAHQMHQYQRDQDQSNVYESSSDESSSSESSSSESDENESNGRHIHQNQVDQHQRNKHESSSDESSPSKSDEYESDAHQMPQHQTHLYQRNEHESSSSESSSSESSSDESDAPQRLLYQTDQRQSSEHESSDDENPDNERPEDRRLEDEYAESEIDDMHPNKFGSLAEFCQLRELRIPLRTILQYDVDGKPTVSLVDVLPPSLEYLLLSDYEQEKFPMIMIELNRMLDYRTERFPNLRRLCVQLGDMKAFRAFLSVDSPPRLEIFHAVMKQPFTEFTEKCHNTGIHFWLNRDPSELPFVDEEQVDTRV